MIDDKIVHITSNESYIFALTFKGTIYRSEIANPEWIIFESRENEKEIKLAQLREQVGKLESELESKKIDKE